MPISGSGEIKLSDIHTEYVDTHDGSAEIQLSDFHDKGNAPASGEIQLATDFYGTSNVTYTSATGGTVTTYTANNVNYKVHSFTSSGTFAVSSVGDDATIALLVVAGGGGGGTGNTSSGNQKKGGGGGAGGMEYYDSTVSGTSGNIGRGPSKTITAQSYTVVVGSGGSGNSSSSRRAGNGGTGSYVRLADGSTYLSICRGGGGGFGDNYDGYAGGTFGGEGGGAGGAAKGDGGSGGGGVHGTWSGSPRGYSYYYNSDAANNTFTSTTLYSGYKQGNWGGTGSNSTGNSQITEGGGGGAAGSGGGGTWSSYGGRGGTADDCAIRTGSAVYYASGGSAGSAGSGLYRQSGSTGSANTGDGGKAASSGYSGGSGIVVIRYVVA